MDRGKAIPFYLQVAETLRGRIRDGHYQVGDVLPPHHELEAEFGVSNITVRKALTMLAQQGYLKTKRGARTTVARPSENLLTLEVSANFDGFIAPLSARRLDIETRVLETALSAAPRRICRCLGADPDHPLWRMRRVRTRKGEPVAYLINYAAPDLMERIAAADVAERTFIELFQDRTKILLKQMTQQVQAIVADMDLARLLGVTYGDPLFFVESIYESDANAAVAVTQMYLRGDRYRYKARLAVRSASLASQTTQKQTCSGERV